MSALCVLQSQQQIAASAIVDRTGLLKALALDDKDELVAVLQQVANAGEEKAEVMRIGDRVAMLMGHPEPEVAAMACVALGCMGKYGQKYAQYILGMLHHPADVARAGACEALGSFGPQKDPAYAQAIVGVLYSGDATVKAAALRALGSMEATSHWEVVKASLSDSSADVKAAAIESLGLLLTESAEVMSLLKPEDLVQIYTESLSSSSTCCSALQSLCVLKDKAPDQVVGAVAGLLSDKDCITRQIAVAAVGAMPEKVMTSKEAAGKVKGLLTSDAPGVRAAAASAIAAVGKPAAEMASAVAELLKDDGEDDSGLAMQVGLGTRRLPPQLRRPKCAAVTALGRLGDASYAPKIAEVLADESWEARMTAAEALGLLGGGAKSEVAALTALLEDEAFPVRGMACYALGLIKDTEAVSRLVETFEDPSYSVRTYAVTAVGEMAESMPDDSQTCHEVFKLISSGVGPVKAAAVRTLSKMGETGANYAGVVATLLYDEDPEVRVAVLEALGNMGSQGASLAEEVNECLDDPVHAVRQAAVASLEMMGYAQPPLLKDWGKGAGVPLPIKGEVNLQGMGQYFAGIQQQKSELMQSGQWIEGVI